MYRGGESQERMNTVGNPMRKFNFPAALKKKFESKRRETKSFKRNKNVRLMINQLADYFSE